MRKLLLVVFVLMVFVTPVYSRIYPTNLTQFAVFSEQWGRSCYWEYDLDFMKSFADIDQNLVVDSSDLNHLVENWTGMGTLYDIRNMLFHNIWFNNVIEAIELYKLDHNGDLPGSGTTAFETALTSLTTQSGDTYISPQDSGTPYGPYLRIIPTNVCTLMNTVRVDGPPAGENIADWRFDSITGEFESDVVCDMEAISWHNWTNHETYPGMARKNPFNGLNTVRHGEPEWGANTHGYWYDDATGQLVPDDNGVPTHFEGDVGFDQVYREMFLVNVLQKVREAIHFYTLDHNIFPPGLGTASWEEAMTGITNENGDVYTPDMQDAGIPSFGPYLPQGSDGQFLPTNPFNNNFNLRITDNFFGPPEGPRGGWAYINFGGGGWCFWADDDMTSEDGIRHRDY